MKPHAQPGCSNDGAPNNKDDQKSLMIKKFHLDMIGDLIVKIQKVALGGWLHSASANEYLSLPIFLSSLYYQVYHGTSIVLLLSALTKSVVGCWCCVFINAVK